MISKSTRVILYFIALCIIQIVSKQIYSEKRENNDSVMQTHEAIVNSHYIIHLKSVQFFFIFYRNLFQPHPAVSLHRFKSDDLHTMPVKSY